MARIQKRKGKKRTSFTATIRMKGFAPITRTFDTKGEALIWAAEIEKEMRAGQYQNNDNKPTILFSEAIEKYLKSVSVSKRVNSCIRDKQTARVLLRYFDKAIPLSDITAQIIAEYRDKRIRVVSPSTIQKEFAFLSHLFNVARKEWGIALENPVTQVSRPIIRNGRTRFLTKEEAQRLLDISKTSRNTMLYPYLLLLMHTGMRPSEAAGLRWGNVDLEARLIHLQVTKTDKRDVPLSVMAEQVLRSIRPSDVTKNIPVFLPETSSLSQNLVNVPCYHFKKSFDTARKRAGLEDVHLHDLRHTAASHLLMAGVDLRTLADILGHKTMQMVQRYTHILNDHKIQAIDRINSLGIGSP